MFYITNTKNIISFINKHKTKMTTKQRTSEIHLSFSQRIPTDVIQNSRNPYKSDFLFVADDFKEGIEACSNTVNALFRALQKTGYKKITHTFDKQKDNPQNEQHDYSFEKDKMIFKFSLIINPEFIKMSKK